MSQLTVDQAIQLALQHQQASQLAEAEEIFRQILTAFPDQADALHLLGGVYLQARRLDLAEKHVRQAIGVRNEGAFHLTLGMILQDANRHEEARGVYVALLKRHPEMAQAHAHLGVVLSILGRFDEAAKEFQEALKIEPGHLQAQGNLGIVLCHLQRYEEAIWLLKSALARNPKSGDFHASLAAALYGSGQIDAALVECKEAVSLSPGHGQAHSLMSFILRSTGRVRDALAPARQAALLLPKFLDVQVNYGECLRESEQSDEAAEHYEKVIERKLVSADIHNNLGNVYKDQGRLDDAIAQYRRALELALAPVTFSNLVYTMHYHPGYTPEMIFKELRRYDEIFVEPLKKLAKPLKNSPDPERRLRVGYMSTEFRQHALGLYLMPLLGHHDKSQFEVFCYADVTKPDFYTYRHRQNADHWEDTHGKGDEEIAEMIRRDQIDILVDLHQHMGGNRLTIYARKPAPVQIGYAGYPNTSGVSAIDYRLTDPYLEPANEPPFPSSEKVLSMPQTWWCYHPVIEVPVNELPAAKNGYVTFGNLNNFCKLNDATYALWAKVMRACEKSQLLLLAPEGSLRDHVAAYMKGQGIGPGRVHFLGRTGATEYYKYYHDIDMCLDSFPYNGHTTSMDSFWMGVPVTSFYGATPWGRGTWSQASNLGLTELVGKNEKEFVELSIALAKDLPRLVWLRKELRQKMRQSPLMDEMGYCRGIEAAYREAWRRWCGS